MNRTLLLFLVAFALVGAACSDGDSASTTAAPSTTASITAVPAPTTTTSVVTTTSIATTTTAAAASAIVAGNDVDVDAVVLAYEVVFSSTTDYEEKVPYLVDPSGLEDTVAKYQETGVSMGGVALAPSAVTINGDVAEVIYDLLFGGTPTYPDLTGDAVLIDDTWKITRDMFCGMMASARVGCPTS